MQSQMDLKSHLGIQNQFYIYPYGHYNSYLEQLLKSQGILMSFTTEYGFAGSGMNLLTLPRVRVHGKETMDRFEQSLGIVFPQPSISVKK